LNVHRQKAGMTSHPKRPRDPNQLAKWFEKEAYALQWIKEKSQAWLINQK
jgi:hypothetical protein